MNNNILKGITESLEFETEMGSEIDWYKIDCKMTESNKLELVIADNGNWSTVYIANIDFGKIKDEDKIMVRVIYKSKQFHKYFTSYGQMIDNLPSVIDFIKESTKTILREMI